MIADTPDIYDPARYPLHLMSEQALLSAVLYYPETLEDVAWLLPEDFAYPENALLWQVLLMLRAQQRAIDTVTIYAELTTLLATAPAQLATMPVYMARLIGLCGMPYAAGDHARRIKQYAVLRSVKSLALEVAALAEANDLAGLTRAAAFAPLLAAADGTASGQSMAAVVSDTLDDMDRRLNGRLPPPIRVGMPTLDKMMVFQPGELALLAARPALGKSALGFQMAVSAAGQGYPALFVSLEMGAKALCRRILSAHTGILASRLKAVTLDDEDWPRLLSEAAQLAGLPLTILAEGDLTMPAIAAVAAQIAGTVAHGGAQGDLSFLVLDYLQLIPTPLADTGRVTRNDALGTISRRLKRLARDLQISVLALCQLNRAGDTTGSGHRPSLVNLRESGSLEQDGDVIMFLSPVNPQTLGSGASPASAASISGQGQGQGRWDVLLDVAKNRDGQTCDIPLYFWKETVRFGEAAT